MLLNSCSNVMRADVHLMSFACLSPTVTLLDISDCCLYPIAFGPIDGLRHLPNLETLDLSSSCVENAFEASMHTAIRGLAASLITLRSLNLVNSSFLVDLMIDDESWRGVSLPMKGLTSLKLSQPEAKTWPWWEGHNVASVFDASIAAWRTVVASIKQVRLQFVDVKFVF
jgi:hypothetical protein